MENLSRFRTRPIESAPVIICATAFEIELGIQRRAGRNGVWQWGAAFLKQNGGFLWGIAAVSKRRSAHSGIISLKEPERWPSG
jgi:hypothetical protein